MKTLGKFPLGMRNVWLKVDPAGTGGSFDRDAERGPEIVVGIGYTEWEEVLSVLLHEAIEFSMCEMDLRWQPSVNLANANDNHLFVLTHGQYSEAIARAALFLAKATPAIEQAFRRLSA